MAEERGGAIEERDQGAATVGWQRTLWAMVGIQFVMTAAFSMLSPIMPLFLPVLGVGSASAVALWAGILAGTTSFVAAFASPLWGRLADRHGRKLMLLRSSIAVGVFAALMGAATNVWQVFACRALMGVFAGFSSTAIALVASQVPEERLGYALGWLSTGQLVGSLVGPLIGGFLADATGSYRIPFYCTAATIMAMTGFVWFGVRERFVPVAQGRGGRALLSSLIAVARSPGLLALFFVLLMAQFGVRTVQPGATRPAARSRHIERHCFLHHRACQCRCCPVPWQQERQDRLSSGIADRAAGGKFDDPAAGLHHQLLGLHRSTVRSRAVHRRHFTDRECTGRAARPAGRARHGLRYYRLGNVSRQLDGPAHRRCCRCSLRAAPGVSGHRSGAAGKPAVGLLPGAGICRSR